MPNYPLQISITPNVTPGESSDAEIVHTKLNAYIDVKADFGAVGDGVTDDTAEIQAAINAAATAGGGVVFIPDGTFGVSTLKIKTGVQLVGAGMYRTTLKMVTTGTGAVIFNDSWLSAPPSWSVTETDYGVSDLTVDSNKSVILSFTYGIHFQRFTNVNIERVRALNTTTGSGIVAQNGSNLTIAGCVTSGTDGNGIFTIDVLNQRVVFNNVLDSGDFGIEIGSGSDYGTAGGTAYGGDGVVIGNVVKDCTNFGIACRGFLDATANPNNHKVKNVVVSGNTVRDSANLNEIAYYELCENITEFGNNTAHGGVGVLETNRLNADLGGVDFTSGGVGAVIDIPGLTVTDANGLPRRRAEITLRVRGGSSLVGDHFVFVDISPAPEQGQAIAGARKHQDGGEENDYVVVNDVVLLAGQAYTFKAQFFQGAVGTFTVNGLARDTELIVVETPIT